MPPRDPYKGLDKRAKEAGKLQETKRNLDSFKPKGPGKTHPIAARVPLDLYERLQARKGGPVASLPCHTVAMLRCYDVTLSRDARTALERARMAVYGWETIGAR